MSLATQVVGGFGTLLTGLGVTFRQIFKRSVTLQYPHERPVLSDAYRSLIKLKRFGELDTHDCVACMQCVKICPSACITIEGGKVEGIKRKRATRFEVDFSLCSLCGLCVDVCPTDTLEYSKLYDEAGYQRDWVYDLLSEFRDDEPAFIDKQKEIEEREAAEKEAKRLDAEKAKASKAPKEAGESGGPGEGGTP